ncbi:PEP-CTERM sorting domain-containing protein [Verrucomicrobiales bacterium]|nr:PEP-CTERM sorting domain-containing protein [Verrucomicrobiales bacterium]
MKNKTKLFSALAIPLVSLTTSHAVSVITSVVVSDGTNLTTLSTTSADPIYPSGASAAIQEFVSGGVTYVNFIGATYVGDVEGVLFPVGGTASSASAALGDLDLATGTLDPLGTGGDPTMEFHQFIGQTITSDTVFFLFSNATPPQNVTLVDSTGAALTNAVSPGAETELNDFSFSRTNGGDLNNREISGFTFGPGDFTFAGAGTLADVAGFRGAGATFDAEDAGIAFAVPEPSSALLLLGGLGAFVIRRRR